MISKNKRYSEEYKNQMIKEVEEMTYNEIKLWKDFKVL